MTASRMIAASDLAYANGSVTAVSDLFDPNDPNVGFGKYVDPTTGVLTATTAYHATGYIPVVPGQQYIAPGPVTSNRRAYYDASKNFLSGVYDFSTSAFTIPAGVAFMRMTVPIANWETLRIKQGTSQLNYEPSLNRALSNDQTLWWLRWTHARLMRLALAESGVQLGIALAGDSYTHNAARYTTRVANYLAAKYGDAGGGWCGFGFLNSGNVAPWTGGNQPSYLNGNARPATYATRLFGNQTSTYVGAGTADLAYTLFSASGDAAEQDFPASPTINGIDLHYVGTGAGQIRYTLNGGTNWTTLDVSGTNGTTAVVALSLANLTQPGTLRIEWVSGTCKLAGVNLKSAAAGVVVHKIAATGSNSGGWATNTALAGFATSFAALGAKLFCYMDGPNDQGGINYTQFVNNLNTIFTKVRAATASIDFLCLMPPENNRGTNTFPIAGYTQLARNEASVLQFALHVIKFGDSGNTAEYDFGGTIPLLDTDSLHPNLNDGGALLAYEFLTTIGAWRG